MLTSRLTALFFLPLTLSCNIDVNMAARSNNSTSIPKFTLGADGPADPATLGFAINHVCLIVNDLNETRRFYGDVIGMRHIFTYDASKEYAIMYMGHAQGGKNGTGFMTGEELLSEKNNLGGLVEFLVLKTEKAKRQFLPTSTNTLSHLGLIVPDIAAAQKRFDSLNVPILKHVGEMPTTDGDAIVARAWGFDPDVPEEVKSALAGIAGIGFQDFVIVADPDGNLLEVQQQASGNF